MQLIVIKKSKIVWDCLFFNIISLFFVFVQNSLLNQSTALRFKNITQFFLTEGRYILIIGLLSIISIYFVKRWSKFLFFVYLLANIFKSAELLTNDLNKMVMILLFIYIIIGFYMWTLWSQELSGSVYNSLIGKSDIKKSRKYKINAIVKLDKLEFKGSLLNWDSTSILVQLEEKIAKQTDKVDIKIEFEGRTFYNSGEIITVNGDKSVLGIIFDKELRSENFNWSDFYNVICDRGFLPVYF